MLFPKLLPSDEKFDLYPQIRRASKNVTENIGEAYGRYHYLDSLHYYSIARGELMETPARPIDARVLEYIAQLEFESHYKLIRQTEQALNGFMSYIRRQRAGSQEYGDRKIRLIGNRRGVPPDVGRIGNPPCAEYQICWSITANPRSRKSTRIRQIMT